MAFFDRPEPKTKPTTKTADKPVQRRKVPESEEIDFIVRREHRRQHREDRAL